MCSSVNSFLGFNGGCIPNREFLVIGQAKDNGSFLLHQIMSAALKEKRLVCLASLTQKFHHYNAVSQKIGVGLKSALEDNQFKFFDGLEELARIFYPEESDLEMEAVDLDLLYILKGKILQLLSDLKQHSSDEVVLVIDELSVLISMGFHVRDVCTFITELQQTVSGMDSSFSQQHSTSVVVLCSYDEDDKDSLNLWQYLVNLSTVDVNVTGLQTGYCKDVHGQACVSWRNSRDAPTPDSVTRTWQFKLGDNSIELFVAGTSAAVL